MNLRTGLGYDDVMAIPQRSPLETRENADTSTILVENVELETPIVSSAMDTVTEKEMAIAMADVGGAGFIHRYLSVEEQANQLASVDNGPVVGTIGIDGPAIDNAVYLYEEGSPSAISIDIAHAHHDGCIETVRKLSENYPDIPIIAGTIATGEAARDLANAGADALRVGIGTGSHCQTRKNTGFGVPQITALRDVSSGLSQFRDDEIRIIADGGIREPGHIAKAIIAGADSVMIGGLFAGCEESPAPLVQTEDGELYKLTRGMASEEARKERAQSTPENQASVEGAECYTEFNGSVREVVQNMTRNLRSSISYGGAEDLEGMRENTELIRQTGRTSQNRGINGDNIVGER